MENKIMLLRESITEHEKERLRIGKKVSKYLAYKLEKYEPHYVFSDDEHIWVTPDHLVEEMYMLIENVKLLRKTQCSHGNDPYNPVV
jgi:endo-1,4-beta-mannosidase